MVYSKINYVHVSASPYTGEERDLLNYLVTLPDLNLLPRLRSTTPQCLCIHVTNWSQNPDPRVSRGLTDIVQL